MSTVQKINKMDKRMKKFERYIKWRCFWASIPFTFKKVFRTLLYTGILFLIVEAIMSFTILGIYFTNEKLDLVDNFECENYDEIEQRLQEEYNSIKIGQFSHKEIQDIVAKEIKIVGYWIIDAPYTPDGAAGATFPVTRVIVMHSSLSAIPYCKTMAHEFTHLKYCNGNERYTEFETFKFLYESDIPLLKKSGISLALDQFRRYGKSYNENYDCLYYILRYLGER